MHGALPAAALCVYVRVRVRVCVCAHRTDRAAGAGSLRELFAELKEARNEIKALKASLGRAYPAGTCPVGEYVQVDKTCGKPASGAKCNAGSFFDAHAEACRPHSVCRPPKTFTLIAGTPREDAHCTKTHPCQAR